MIIDSRTSAYVILIEDDNSMTITQKRRIVQGSNLVDHLYFLVNPEYNGHNMEDFDALLSYVSPISFEMHEELLCKSSESYKNFLTYVLPFDSKITDEAGPVDLMLTFREHHDGECVRNITGVTVDIVTDVSQDETTPTIGFNEIEKQIAKVNKQIKEINKTSDFIIDTKADNVSYDRDTGDLQLMANGQLIGDKINIGLQNSDSVFTDDKFLEMMSLKPDRNEVVLKNEIEEIDAIEIAAYMGLVCPIAAEDGSVYTDENGVLYSL